MTGPTGYTISVVTGTVAYRDAVSNICRQQVEALDVHLRERGVRACIRVYTHGAEPADSRYRFAGDARALAADEHFLASDLVLFHFGIRYPLFDAIHLAPRTARTVVCYYGITPPELMPPEQRPALQTSYRQAAVNLPAADRVIVNSAILRDDLAGLGVAVDRIVQVPLAASFRRPAAGVPARPGRPGLALLCVGRFVPAKGVHDLLEAVRLARTALPAPLTVTLVGSRTFSDRRYLDGLQASVREHGLDDVVRFLFDIGKRELVEQMLAADVLVAPSYHEGFCVPVIEAMSCGAFVVCSDAGALPETSGGLGRCYPAGDAAALAEKLREFATARAQGGVQTDGGFLSAAEWQARVAGYLKSFTPEQHEAAFCRAVLDGLTPADEGVKQALSRVRRELLAVTVPTAPPLDHNLEARLGATIAMFGRS